MRRKIECNPEQLKEKNLVHKDQEDKQRLSQTLASQPASTTTQIQHHRICTCLAVLPLCPHRVTCEEITVIKDVT